MAAQAVLLSHSPPDNNFSFGTHNYYRTAEICDTHTYESSNRSLTCLSRLTVIATADHFFFLLIDLSNFRRLPMQLLHSLSRRFSRISDAHELCYQLLFLTNSSLHFPFVQLHSCTDKMADQAGLLKLQWLLCFS